MSKITWMCLWIAGCLAGPVLGQAQAEEALALVSEAPREQAGAEGLGYHSVGQQAGWGDEAKGLEEVFLLGAQFHVGLRRMWFRLYSIRFRIYIPLDYGSKSPTRGGNA